MEVIVIANQKGGIGKTTTSIGVAGALQALGKKVLFVDMDEQCNSTDTYRAAVGDGIGSIFDVLVEEDYVDCIQHTEMGDIIAGDPMMKDAAKHLDNLSGIRRLKKALNVLGEGYDYVVVDTPPALSISLTNSLTAADSVIIPVSADRYGLKGLVSLYETISDVREYSNPNIKIMGFLVVKHRGGTQLTRAMEESLPRFAELFETKVFDTRIREGMEIRKAQAAQESFFEAAPYAAGIVDYRVLGYEITGMYKEYREAIGQEGFITLMGKRRFVEYLEHGKFEELFGEHTFEVLGRLEVQKIIEREGFYKIIENEKLKDLVIEKMIHGDDLDFLKEMIQELK